MQFLVYKGGKLMKKVAVLVVLLFTTVFLLTGCKTKEVKVMFDTDGGDPIETIILKKGSTYDLPTPTKKGSVFKEWQLEGVKFTNDSKVMKDITIKAIWELEKYMVIFKVDDKVVKTEELEYGQLLKKPVAPVKEGKEFSGWVIAGVLYDFQKPVASNLTLHASFDASFYDVVYKNGDQEFLKQSVMHGSKATMPEEVPAQPNKEFVQWLLEGEAYDFNTEVIKPLVIEAEFINVYTVKFMNGETVFKTEKVKHGLTVAKPEEDPKQPGKNFQGWVLGETGYNFSLPVTKDLEIIASYDAINYTVTFKVDGLEDITQIKKYGEKYTKPSDPVVPGYKFIKWMHGEVEYNFDTLVTENITLNAEMEDVRVVVTVKIKDESSFGPASTELESINSDISLHVRRAALLTQSHWMSFNSINEWNEYLEDAKLRLELDEFNHVEFVVQNRKDVHHLSVNYLKDDHNFYEWYIPTGKITSATLLLALGGMYKIMEVHEGNQVFDFDTDISKDTTLTVTLGTQFVFYKEDGTTEHQNIIKIYKTSFGEVKADVLEYEVPYAYVFKGWADQQNPSVIVDDSKQFSKDVVRFIPVIELSPDAKKVTFKTYNKENEIIEKYILANDQVGDLPFEGKRIPWIFAGFYTAKEEGEKITAETVITDDITFHAQWDAKIIVNFDGEKMSYKRSPKTLDYTTEPFDILVREGKVVADEVPLKLATTASTGFLPVKLPHADNKRRVDLENIYKDNTLQTWYTGELVSPGQEVYIDCITEITYKIAIKLEGNLIYFHTQTGLSDAEDIHTFLKINATAKINEQLETYYAETPLKFYNVVSEEVYVNESDFRVPGRICAATEADNGDLLSARFYINVRKIKISFDDVTNYAGLSQVGINTSITKKVTNQYIHITKQEKDLVITKFEDLAKSVGLYPSSLTLNGEYVYDDEFVFTQDETVQMKFEQQTITPRKKSQQSLSAPSIKIFTYTTVKDIAQKFELVTDNAAFKVYASVNASTPMDYNLKIDSQLTSDSIYIEGNVIVYVKYYVSTSSGSSYTITPKTSYLTVDFLSSGQELKNSGGLTTFEGDVEYGGGLGESYLFSNWGHYDELAAIGTGGGPFLADNHRFVQYEKYTLCAEY